MGTAGYMSPEQVRGEKLDARTDIFSFGLVLYEMATGQRAFTGETAAVVHDAILTKSPVPARELNSKLPPNLGAVINRALEKHRGRRYQSAAEMQTDVVELRASVRARRQGGCQWLVVVVLLAAISSSGWLYWRSHHAVKLTGKDTIVLGEFKNTTGDAVFDETLRQALAIQLEQSPLLNVLSDQRVSETLRLMNRSANESLTQAVAQELCLRTNGRALLSGSIAPVGDHFVISARATDCRSGNTLASAGSEANNRNQVLKSLQDVGNQLRRKLGESLVSVEKLNQPLEEATTSSLEALQAYTLGVRMSNEKSEWEAIPHYRRALALDPNFALAYVALSIPDYNYWNLTRANQNSEKAYELRGRVSQRERLYIEATYYQNITGQLEKAIQSLTEWTQIYPTDYLGHRDLGWGYLKLGQYEEAITEEQKALRLSPNDWRIFHALIVAYTALGRWDEAKNTFEQAEVRNLIHPRLRYSRYILAFCQNDDAAMREQLARSAGTQGEEYLLFGQSFADGYHGKLVKENELLQRIVETAQRTGESETAAGWKLTEAQRDAEIGKTAQARRKAAEALALSTGKEVRVGAALAFTRTGEVARGRRLMHELNQEFPLDTLIQGYWLPTIQAASEMHDDPSKALELLKTALPCELCKHIAAAPNLYATYLRGLVYLRLGEGQNAAGEFQKILDHPGIVWASITGALAHLQLARAQVMMGDEAAARKSYQDFLTLWKDADPDIPIYKQAKAEYAKLR
jgi:tetratricopeptide (TPR) repeat protein